MHYWCANALAGPYAARYDNVLLPQGNYAGRVMAIEGHHLLWNFFVSPDESGTKILPPPKEVDVGADGRLLLSTFDGFNDKVEAEHPYPELMPLRTLLSNPTAASGREGDTVSISCDSGYEIFLLARECMDFRLHGIAVMEGTGKSGFCIRSDMRANALFVSLVMVNGIAQARTWRISQL